MSDPVHPIDVVRNTCEEIRDELRKELALMGAQYPTAKKELDYWQVIWDCIPLMMINLADPSEPKILEATPAAHSLFGYELWELLGLHINELIPHELREVHNQYVLDYKKDPHDRQMGHQRGIQLSGLKKDGTILQLEIGLYASRVPNKDYVFLTIQKTGEGHV